MCVGMWYTCIIPGSWPDMLLCKHCPLGVSCKLTEGREFCGWHMIWMLLEMANITLKASVCQHGPKMQGLIMHQLWCICGYFCVYRWGLSRDVCNYTTWVFCSSLWTQQTGWITMALFVCLSCILGEQQNINWSCDSEQYGSLSNLKD